MDPEVFLRAAESIDSHRDNFACWAILNTGHESAYIQKERFVDLFCPRPETSCLFEGRRSAFFSDQKQTGDKNRQDRVIALLLAYEIAKDEANRARWAKNSKAYRARWKWRRLRKGECRRAGDQFFSLSSGSWVPAFVMGPLNDTDHAKRYRRRVKRKAAK